MEAPPQRSKNGDPKDTHRFYFDLPHLLVLVSPFSLIQTKIIMLVFFLPKEIVCTEISKTKW